MCLAVPGLVLSVEGDELSRRARVSFGGIVKQVSLACLAEAGVGDYVLVHAGIAISRVDPEEAERVFRYLEDIDEVS